MKRIKRIISVILLILVLFVVGYMCKTCSRLESDIRLEELEYTAYYSEDYTITLIVSAEYLGEYTAQGERYDLTFKDYKDGVMRFETDGKEYLFTVLDDGDLFDNTAKKLLIRSKVNEK